MTIKKYIYVIYAIAVFMAGSAAADGDHGGNTTIDQEKNVSVQIGEDGKKTVEETVKRKTARSADDSAKKLARIAVTDLSYEEQVANYFHHYEYHSKSSSSDSFHANDHDSEMSSSSRNSGHFHANDEESIKEDSGVQLLISRGELRKFTSDIKGDIIKSRKFRVVQGKPWTGQNTEKLFDIIGRIKNGFYPGSDYVLFGTISNIEYRSEDQPIQGSNAVSHTLSMEMVVDFSLVDTKTYEVKASFSAQGEGEDTRLTNSMGSRVVLNRSKVIQEVSRSLGEAVLNELLDQYDPTS